MVGVPKYLGRLYNHIVTFKIDDELLQRLDLYCANKKVYRSEVIREALREYLEKEKRD